MAEAMTRQPSFETLAPADLVFLPQRVGEIAETRGSDVALGLGGDTLTYAALADLAGRFAAFLRARGVGAGVRVAILTSHNLRWQAAHLGIVAAGGTVVMLPTTAGVEAVSRMVEDCAAALLLHSSDMADLAEAVRGQASGVALDDPAIGNTSPIAPLPRDAAGEIEIIYSSGTTGRPKGIVVAAGPRTRTYTAYAQFGMGADAVMLCTTPPYANPTLGSTFGTLFAGGRVVYLAKFDTRAFLETAERERVTHMFLVPTQVIRLLADPEFDRFDLSATQLKLTGSAALPVPVKRDLLARWPGAFVETYGMTEGGPISVLFADRNPDRLDSVGQVPAGAVIHIIGEDGRVLPTGETGEIVGRSGAMMMGYNNRPEESRALEWRDAAGDLYFRSGDLGRFDAAGFLHIAGRKKEVIISGGFNIYAVDLETVLADHPAVLECAVVARPDPTWGETPVAFVELAAACEAETLRQWANDRLGRHQRLAAVTIVDALPRSAMGKVLKQTLLERGA